MYPTGIKVTVTGVAGLAMLAQELPLPDWAQKSALMACIAILGTAMLWVLPQMFNRLMEHGTRQMEQNTANLKELGQKIDSQTIKFVEAISQLNHK